jgi:S1-C subfamily serine protease
MPMIRVAAATALFLLLVFAAGPHSAAAAPYCPEGQEPGFSLGFARLQAEIGATMGVPVECEHSDVLSSDTLQNTTTGLAFYRKSTGIVMFTDGWNHWALTNYGIVTWQGAAIDPPGDAFPVAAGTLTAPAGGGRLALESVIARNDDSVLRVVVPSGCASAHIVTADGYAVTNQHVVEDNPVIEVWLRDGRQMLATVLASDAANDLALIKLPGRGYAPVQFGNSGGLALGAGLALLGHPVTAERASFGCSTDLTVSTGILSSRVSQLGLSWLQTDAALNSGISGGAAFDLSGAFVGIPAAGIDPASADNIGYIIPADRARPIVDNWVRAHRAGALPPVPGAPAPVVLIDRGALDPTAITAGAISDPGGVDRWTFNGTAGELVALESWGIDTYLRLYDPDGALLDQNDDGSAIFLGSRIRHILPATGTYSVRLNGFAGDQGEYAIEFLRVAATDRGGVASGQAVGGALAADEVHLWTFPGGSGQDIQIDVSGFDTNLRLYAPDGRLVAANDDGLPDFGSRISTRLFAAGLYIIEVTGVFGDSGTYTLLPTAGAAEYRDRGALPEAGVAVNGTIAAGELEVWSFRGREGFIVRVETWGIDTIIELYGPDMTLLEVNDDDAAGTGSFIRRQLWTAGTYRVVVRGFEDTAGTYSLVYTGAGSGAVD